MLGADATKLCFGWEGVQQPFPYRQVSSVSFFKKAFWELGVPKLGMLDEDSTCAGLVLSY